MDDGGYDSSWRHLRSMDCMPSSGSSPGAHSRMQSGLNLGILNLWIWILVPAGVLEPTPMDTQGMDV